MPDHRRRQPRVLIVDDEPDMRWVIGTLLREHGYAVAEAEDGSAALSQISTHPPDVVLSDVRMPKMDGVQLLRALAEQHPDLPVILLSAVEDLETAVGAMRDGAYDYLAKPFDPARLLVTLDRAAERADLHREVHQLRSQLATRQISFGISAAAQQLDRTIDLVAPQPSLSVLIHGDSGTGKEVVARELHARSPVAEGPFVAVDCGALPEQLMESQLFGHRKGAFTGADRDHHGLFRMADGGSLFLDELGNLPLPLQAKLLRVLQERMVTPLGGGDPLPFRVRLLSASNTRLLDDVASGRFRVDLYHRVAEFVVDVPPLRERPEDALFFASRFLAEANAEMGKQISGIDAACEQRIRAHSWHGNLRELRNAIRRAVVLAEGPGLVEDDLGLGTPADPDARREPPQLAAHGGSLTERIRQAAEALEAEILADTLRRCEGNKAAAARELQIDYTTLHRKLKRHRVDASTLAPPP